MEIDTSDDQTRNDEQQLSQDEEEDDGLTAQTAVLAVQDAWLNEKFAPELLPHQGDLVDCMLQQIAHMEENIKGLDRSDIRLVIHRMEIDRIRFVIASYLRVRLEKIETYTVHILSQEANRSPAECYLTPAEHKFANEFLANTETLFKNIALQHMPGNFSTFEVDKLDAKPNMNAYVFLRANERVAGIMISGTDEEIDFEQGSQHIIQYSAVAELVKSGAVQLI